MRIKRLAAAVTIGLLTTIGIAWGCAWFVSVSGPERVQSLRARNVNGGEGRGTLSLARTDGWGSVFLDAYAAPPSQPFATDGWDPRSPEALVPHGLLGAALPWVNGAAPWPQDDDNDVRTIDARGWPLLCLWSEYETATNEQFKVVAIPHGAITIPRNEVNKGSWINPYARTLPLRPIWSGLAINTLIFSSAWWLLLTVPRALRTKSRLDRGLCTSCAYALNGLPKCPECGKK